jgi:salicylate hydroxylase
MLDRLGLTDAVLAECHQPLALIMRDGSTADEMARIPTGRRFHQRFKFPYAVLHRVDLHRVLLAACNRLDTVKLHADTTVTGFQDFGDRVCAFTSAGQTINGAAIIGADGLRSRVRAQLSYTAEPRTTGCVGFRTVVPISQVPQEMRENNVVLWAGEGYHLMHYPLRRGELFNIVASFGTATRALQGDDCQGEIRKYVQNAHPIVRSLFDLMDLQRSWIISDRDPIRHWSKGRVTLLGDAAHPALQSMAQGACMAIEDGVCLADRVELIGGITQKHSSNIKAIGALGPPASN